MKRNPYFKEWSHDAQPDGYPDEIIQSYGLTVEAQVTAVENGQADWTLRERRRPTGSDEIGTKYASQVHVNPLTAFWYAPDERQPPAVQQPEGTAGGELRDRPQRSRQDLRRPEPRVAVVPGAAARASRGTRTTARTRRTPARRGRRPTSRRRSSSSRSPGTAGQKVTVVLVGRRREQGDGRLRPERAQRDRLQGHGQADLREHLLHLRPEHEEQGADQRAAVVPGLPGCLGLPLRPVRLRVVPPGQRLEHQLLGLLQQADQRPDAQGAQPSP